jgi:putative PEP-CTERM system histidine kinase
MRNAAILAFVAALLGGVVAVLAAFRERRSIAKWSFVAGMTLLALESLFSGLAAHTDQGGEAVKYWQQWRLATLSLLPGTWLLFSLSYARGNSREFLFRWRLVLVVAFVLPVALVWFFYPHLITVVSLAIEPDMRLLQLTSAGLVLYASFLIGTVLMLVNLERTFRAAVGTMRWRIKFMILGLGVLFAVRVFTSSQALLWPGRGIDESFLTVDSAGLLLGCAMILRSLLRGSTDVAVYPPFAVIQNSLIVLLAGIYLMVVGVYASFVCWIGAGASFQTKAFIILVALVGLTVVGLSDRVRLHTRRFLSRYLQRPFYDYRTVWRSFTEAIASRVKQEELCEAAARQVAEIFQALSVTIWLVDEKRENLFFASSTSLSPAAGKELGPQKEEAMAIIQTMQDQPEPKDIETSNGDWAVALRRCHPTQFRTGGSRVCVPMTAGRQLMGVMTLGDRVGGIFFSLQDFDLLKCVGNQVAAGLLNAQLSQKLLQTRELEAFQTMSAFFVHDLKNTASTLNLMLQNLPVHFDNPAFREDALRGVAKTCEHINHLIGRLSLLRHDLHIRPAELDLNDLIAGVLANWNGATEVSLVKNFRPCPRILLDKEQILKVVTNLMLNATEAVSKGGQIVVETGQSNGWAVLTVSDNGCGMDPEFLRRALFRPFQTTKKDGFGIGMFQSKMIVEAHGGRIEVESVLKKGTTFRVLLPVQKQLT